MHRWVLSFLITTIFVGAGCSDDIANSYCSKVESCGFLDDSESFSSCERSVNSELDYTTERGCRKEFESRLSCIAGSSCDTLASDDPEIDGCHALEAQLDSCVGD